MSRILVPWQPIGISMGVQWEFLTCVIGVCHITTSVSSLFDQIRVRLPLSHNLSVTRYLKERKQFGAPLAAFQLNQEKLVRMLGDIQAMVLVGWRLCKLYESGKMTSGHSSLGKVRKLQTCNNIASSA